MKFDRYDIFARLVPAVLTAIPLYVLYFFLLSPHIGAFVGALLALKIASDATVSVAILYLAAQINRFLAKEIYEKRIFKNGLHLPTTSYLMHGNLSLSDDATHRVHHKIKQDFGINIPTADEETKDEERSRLIIKEAVSAVRIKVSKGRLVHQHNIEYGFARNLVGGSILGVATALVASLLFLWAYPNLTAAWLSVTLFVFYGLIIIFGTKIISSFGMNYCEVLIQEYLSL